MADSWQEYHGGIPVRVYLSLLSDMWGDGKQWEEVVNSIEVIGSAEEIAKLKFPWQRTAPPKTTKPSRKGKPSGVLLELPTNLKYLLEPALLANAANSENLEDQPELLEALELAIKNATQGESRGEALTRLKADRGQLAQWLRDYPADRYPETLGLAFILGALQYADQIADAIKEN